jgi:indole-3-glycerol phosphate synthase
MSIKPGILLPNLSPTLRRLVTDTALEMEQDQAVYPLKLLQEMIRDAPLVDPLASKLRSSGSLIAEIKERSPSQGPMRAENVRDARGAYKAAPFVKAISVLTNRTHFGANMTVATLRQIKQEIGKPVLRKDFIFDEYQVYQARAFGADAVLLMANVLTKEALAALSEVVFELGMEALFETHGPEEIEALPSKAELVGINSRIFTGGKFGAHDFRLARALRRWGAKRDHSVDLGRLEYVGQLPERYVKIAESGVTPQNCRHVLSLGFHAILVGTSLLTDERGVKAALEEFGVTIGS